MKNLILDILYQDEQLVVVNKPHGIAVHASKMYKDDIHFVLQTLRDQIQQKVFPAHRLDKKTSGALLFSLNETMNIAMQGLFATKEVDKTYHALVRGFVNEAGSIDYPIINNEGKLQEALTHYKPLQFFQLDKPLGKFEKQRYTLLSLHPETGRYHQLRKHLAHIFHPIIGDRPHGCNKQNKLWKEQLLHDSMLLHAKYLSFFHPERKEKIYIEAPYSPEFNKALSFLKQVS